VLSADSTPAPLLDVRDLTVDFRRPDGTSVRAVDGLGFHVRSGEVLGIVGESGCGKSVTAHAIMRLLDDRVAQVGGAVELEGGDLLALGARKMDKVRGRSIGMIFQDPLRSLNPVQRVGDQIAETLRLHTSMSRAERRARSIELLREVGLPEPERRVRSYPHELSGGQRQRVMIAIALACGPQLLIADEPTTALDVTVQAQILALIERIQEADDLGVILITHDLGVVAEVCDRVLVMYLGQIVESGTVDQIVREPRHPYTRALLEANPGWQSDRDAPLVTVPGSVPSLEDVPTGCRFAGRCPFTVERCWEEPQRLETTATGSSVRCWRSEELADADWAVAS